MPTVVFSGPPKAGTATLAKTFLDAGFTVTTVSAPELHKRLVENKVLSEQAIQCGSMAALLQQAVCKDLVVVASLATPSAESIDVGTHALIRGAAANYASVTVVVEESAYEWLQGRVRNGGKLLVGLDERAVLARTAFAATAAYDSQVLQVIEESLARVNVMVLGAGGREHALAWKLIQSPRVAKVFVCPGNGGTATDRSGRIENVSSLSLSNHGALIEFAKANGVALVVVGPEQPLVEGVVDSLSAAGLRCFGPSAAAAQIEASKAFSKSFMAKHGLPTARFGNFTDPAAARDYVEAAEFDVVIKASGLAAGKGVLLPTNRSEALAAVDEVMVQRAFGDAGAEVVIEERMTGPEVSVLAFCDGTTAVCMPGAQDHKRALDGDEGANTGGMGAYAPAPVLTPELKVITDRIMQDAVTAMAQEGRPFVGVLYGGFMLTPGEGEGAAPVPKLLEFNCRFGDPETQVLLPLLDSDLFAIMNRCVDGTLALPAAGEGVSEGEGEGVGGVRWRRDAHAATVVVASDGYPGPYVKGKVISGLEEAGRAQPNVTVFHAGTVLQPTTTAAATTAAAAVEGQQQQQQQVVSSGGRVLAVSAVAASLRGALLSSYTALGKLHFEGGQFRTDIGSRAVRQTESSSADAGSSSSAPPPLRLGVLGSTRGTDLQAILDAISDQSLNASVEVVISNRSKAGILTKARDAGVRAVALGAKGLSREEFDARVSDELQASGVELVLLIGYMRIVSAAFCARWAGRLLNVHPSLLPEFAGGMDTDVHQAVLDAGRRESGCTIHHVTEQVDGGPIVVQLRCVVEEGETAESLKTKVQTLEGQAFLQAINQFLAGSFGPAQQARAACEEKTARGGSTPAAATALSYKSAGVDIDAGAALVTRIKPACKSTRRPGCDADLGGFGGLFDLKAAGYGEDTILVACTDGVGTKLKVAQMAGDHSGVGIDLVAMCVNDLVVQGAEPLFFLDYYATGKLEVEAAAAVVEGIAEGCRQSRCGLIGGETAEMPQMYGPGDYDLAGFSVGAVERSGVLPTGVSAGDVLISLPSSGCHSNGFSLVRKLISSRGFSYEQPCPWAGGEGRTLGQALLTPTRIYVAATMPLIRANLLRGMAHITGGGLPENIPRVLPSHLRARVDLSAWPLPPVFAWMKAAGGLATSEMTRTFNCGVGMILVVAPENKEKVLAALAAADEPCHVIGSLEELPGGGVATSPDEQLVVEGDLRVVV